jgi:hypothetical protein
MVVVKEKGSEWGRQISTAQIRMSELRIDFGRLGAALKKARRLDPESVPPVKAPLADFVRTHPSSLIVPAAAPIAQWDDTNGARHRLVTVLLGTQARGATAASAVPTAASSAHMRCGIPRQHAPAVRESYEPTNPSQSFGSFENGMPWKPLP